QRFCVAVNGDPSGIRDVKPTDLQPKQQQIYNLKGQKVNSFYRGIMVKNGKKIMPF
ncbi:MAG: hypothetical protein HUK07_08415, partial [Bacteroidaceae bacterium]|nr:hypothetical protein [Bacteroidaceae bacterium]